MASDDIPEDRFTAVTGNNADNLCFLCLKESDNFCKHCGIPYCSKEHFDIHYEGHTMGCLECQVELTTICQKMHQVLVSNTEMISSIKR